MANLIKRLSGPVVRVTTMEPVEHERVFEEFASHMMRQAIEKRAMQEPRIVSFRRAALR